MGYYTKFEIDVIPESRLAVVIRDLKDASGYRELFEDDIKWYKQHENCLELSKRGTEVIIISGDGEEPGDTWKKAYFNGEVVWQYQFEMPSLPAGIEQDLRVRLKLSLKDRKAAEKAERIKELEEELKTLKNTES